ncbi:MAG: MotA/TolQ/ExbB proton channel family protein [Kiritimatiellia bacterium]
MINYVYPYLTLPVADALSAFRMSNFSGKIIVFILFLGSIGAWSVMLSKYHEVCHAQKAARTFLQRYRQGRHPLEIFQQQPRLAASPPAMIYIEVCRRLAGLIGGAGPGTDLTQAPYTMHEHEARALRNLADQIMAEQALALEKNMIFLATAVTAAPFLGLLGTVWGVMDAFGGLALSGMATMSAVAPGVSGALLTTVVGLVVALPSAIGYNFLTGRIRGLNILNEHFMQEFLADIESRFMRQP